MFEFVWRFEEVIGRNLRWVEGFYRESGVGVKEIVFLLLLV